MSTSIGLVELGSVPRIAVPLFDDDVRGDVEAVDNLADIVELRIDCFSDLSVEHVRDVIGRVRDTSRSAVPIIATIRSAEEGGKARLADGARAALYEAVTPLVDAVDVELRAGIRDRVLDCARAHGRVTIVSFHDFDAMPSAQDLDQIFKSGQASAADVVKIAAAAKNQSDVLTLLEFTLRHRSEVLVTMVLGEIGTISRVFFPLAGSRLTFGYHRAASAPGQLPLRELHAELRRYYPAFAEQARKRGV